MPVRRWLRELRRGSAVAVVADLVRRWRGIRLLTRSGLVDGAHYRAQVGAVDDHDIPAHYVDHGAAAGASPHPLFDPAYYLAGSPAAARSAAAPFVEFLDRGCHRTTRPHPLFDPAVHLAAAPSARRHRFGPFGHFLAQPRAAAPTSSPWGEGTTVDPVAYARHAAEVRRRVADRRALAAVRESADAALVDADELLARSPGLAADGPVVAVVLPTFRRRAMVEAAIASVQAQSWPHWELVVVDDGGDDGTDELVGTLAASDPRISYVWQQNGGVASARNRGIRTTTAPYVAYLDSDNTWEPRFLEVMVAELVGSGARAAHAASAIGFVDRVAYRATPVDRERLLRGNHVDCITIVHERSLVDEIGGFDERLVRFVDWDLLLRMTAATDVRYVPYLATSYVVGDAADHDRITTTASPGWRDVVQAKHLVDWSRQEPPAPGTTVVVVLEGGDPEVPAWLHRLRAAGLDVVVADAGIEDGLATELELAADLDAGLVVAAAPFPVGRGVARQLGLAAAGRDVVVLVTPGAAVTGDQVRELAERARASSGVAAPVLVDGSGIVRGAAVTMLPSGDLVRWGVGRLPDDERLLPEGDHGPVLVEDGVVAIAAPLLRRLRGVDPLFVGGGGLVDLSRRAIEDGAPVEVVEDVVVVTGAELVPGGSPTRHDREALRARWAGTGRAPEVAVDATGRRPRIVADPGGGVPRRWIAGIDRDERRRWAVVTCVTDRHVAETWGDWHFARSLAEALRRLGEHVVVDTATSRSRESGAIDDVQVLLRGVNPVAPVPGAANVMWVISHVDDVGAHEADGVGLVLAAGEPAARSLAARLGRDVETLLQCTDPTRFRAGRAEEAPVAASVLFVGNTRGQPRPIVTDALAAGLDLTVVGAGWDGIVPDDRVVATHVPNDELGAWYAAAGVVLADHWPDMRRHGVVANRVFDAVAAGATVVSDDVDGLARLFGGAVVPYAGGADGLRAAVETARGRRPGPGPGAAVRERHSFDARARRLLEIVEELDHRG